MLTRLSLLAAILTLGATPCAQAATAKPAPKAAPAKPAPAKPPAPRPAAAAGAFDARDPASLAALLDSMGAKAEISHTGEHGVALKVATPSFSFGVQYVDCDARGKACQALAFSTAAEKRGATLVQINAFNQTSISCRAFQDSAGKPHVMYSAVLFARDTREELRMHAGVWQGCLTTFGTFLTDPAAYLASAP